MSQNGRAVEKGGGRGGGGAPAPPPLTIFWRKFFFPRKIGKHKISTCE